MPLDPVKIPQNVYVEDRIVGPLTLRQTLIIAITGGFSYAMYSQLVKLNGGNPGIVFTVLAWIPLMIGVAFALIRINDLSLTRILFLAIEKSQKPSTRSFGPRRGITITVRTGDDKAIEQHNKKLLQEEMEAKQAQKKISELSKLVDTAFTEETQEAPAEEQNVTITQKETDYADKRPVDPSRITADGASPKLQSTEFTDLSAFRDIFPPSHPTNG